MLFGWSAKDSLEMPACRFFSILNAGIEIEHDNQAVLLASLCDISSISLGNHSYYKDVRQGFTDRMGLSYKSTPVKQVDHRPLDGDEAKLAIFGLFGAARRFV